MLCGVALGACVREPRTAERAVLALAVLGSVAMTALAVLAARSEAPPRWRHGQGSAAPAAWDVWDAGLPRPQGLGRNGLGLGTQGLGLRTQGLGLGTQGLGLGTQGLGSGTQGLGLGTQGLGFGRLCELRGEAPLARGGCLRRPDPAQIAGPSGSVWRGRQRVAPKLPTYLPPRLATRRS